MIAAAIIAAMIFCTLVAWSCCVVAADADARSEQFERQCQAAAERGGDFHNLHNLTNRERNHG